MRLAIVTNIRSPYRILQINEFAKIKDILITVYYTHKASDNRKWESIKSNGFKEVNLSGIKLFKRYGYINKDVIRIVKDNDVIIMGGYEQPTYMLLNFLCKLYKRKSILLYDGISTDRLTDKENIVKKAIKSFLINNADFILGNGKVSREYFTKIFKYPESRIYNQYLTVDTKTIDELYKNKEEYRRIYRKKYNISTDKKVLIFSGRLIDIKNIQSVIKAISKLNAQDIVFMIIGGGGIEKELLSLSKKLHVNCIITGFIQEQKELFKHYFAGDALILPSIHEPWGLVVNEAMCAGLPVLISNVCGSSMDLVKDNENGYIINPYDISEIGDKIKRLFNNPNFKDMGKRSKEIIGEWSFESSRKQLGNILENIEVKQM